MAVPWSRGNLRRSLDRGGWKPSETSNTNTLVASQVPSGSLLATIDKKELEDLSQNESRSAPPTITECNVIGSYNWLNRQNPTILTPGCPPAWTPVLTSKKLPEDDGTYFRDQNAARFALHVFQPAIEAILHNDPEFDLSNLDIMACVSTLRSLLRFVTVPGQGFRMVVEAIGSTVFLVRRGISPTETIRGVFGYGHTFPEANTTWNKDVKGSESHQRILSYKFAGISCAVRYEGDGYLPSLHKADTICGEDTADSAEHLLTRLQHTSVRPLAVAEGLMLATESAGMAIPQSAMFDLKTRSARKEYKDVLGGELPRLWLAQIPNFVVGFHNRGVFDEVRVEDVRQEIQDWEAQHQPQLQKLATLLRTLIVFARGQPDGRFEVVFNGGDRELEFREVSGEMSSCVADAVKRRWCRDGLKQTQLDEG